ncbi:MAG: PepSY-associated TM helix domain-containing protein [Nostoc sp.]|uniref:PepSY-associated TM helix domain-containing protein n=1 Tax=Nostoc sp. TaxID=1180 RepID=UPI002FFBBBE4
MANASLAQIDFPEKPEDGFGFSFDLGDVSVDLHSGKVQVYKPTTSSLGDRVLNSFNDLHYGTFWGFPSRIFYLFVGLIPLILFITGFVMWWYRKRKHKDNYLINRVI